MTCVFPVSGSTVTNQRSLLSADDAEATANLPSAETAGMLQRISRSAFDDDPAGFSASAIGGAKLPSAQTDLPVWRLRTANSRRSCVSPTFDLPGMSSV